MDTFTGKNSLHQESHSETSNTQVCPPQKNNVMEQFTIDHTKKI